MSISSAQGTQVSYMYVSAYNSVWCQTMPINTFASSKYDQLQTPLSQQQQFKSSKASVKAFIWWLSKELQRGLRKYELPAVIEQFKDFHFFGGGGGVKLTVSDGELTRSVDWQCPALYRIVSQFTGKGEDNLAAGWNLAWGYGSWTLVLTEPC